MHTYAHAEVVSYHKVLLNGNTSHTKLPSDCGSLIIMRTAKRHSSQVVRSIFSDIFLSETEIYRWTKFQESFD